MAALYRYLRRLIVIAAVALLVGLAALVLFTRTAQFNRLAQARLAPYLATTFKGAITIGSIEGSLWGDLELRNVTLHYAGIDVLRIPRVVVGYDLLPILWRTIHLRVYVFDPVGDLIRDRASHWNLLEALSERQTTPQPTGAPPLFALELDAIAISGGVIEIAPDGGARYRLLGLRTDGNVAIASTGLNVNLRKLEMTVATPGKPPAGVQASLSYDEAGAAPRLELADLRVWTDRSALVAAGVIRLSDPFDVKARVSLTRLAVNDLAAFVPGLPLRADLSGTIDVTGPANAMRTTVALAAAGASLDASAQTDVTIAAPSYSVKLKLGAADLKKLVRTPGVEGVVGAELTAQGKGFAVGGITGHGTIWGRDLRASARAVGAAQVAIQLAGKDLRATGTVAGPAGALVINGVASLSADPTYRFSLTARRFDFAQVGPPGTVATNLNLDATVDGRGLDVATLDTRVTANLSSSQVAGATIGRGDVETRIVRGQAQIARASFDFEGATLTMRGTGGLAPGTESDLTYALRAPSLARLLKRAQVDGDGSLEVNGVVRGPRERLRTSGSLGFTSLRAAGYGASAGQIRYDLAASGGAIPTGTIEAQTSNLKMGVNLRHLGVVVTAPPGPGAMITVKLSATNDQGRRDHLTLLLDYRPPALSGRLDEAEFALPDGVWRLAAPVSFAANPRAVVLGRMEMRNGVRELIAEGSLSRAGAQAFSLNVASIGPELIAPIQPHAPRYAGSLTGSLRVNGTAAQPLVDLQATAAKIAVDDNRIGDLNVQLSLRRGKAKLDAALHEDPANVVMAAGTLSASADWTRGLSLRTGNDLDLNVSSPRVDLDRLAAFAPATLHDFHGVGALDLRLQGSPLRPVANGNIRISGVKGEIVPLGVKLDEAHARIDVDPQELKITAFSARAGDGSLTATGAIAMANYTAGAAQASVKFDNWPAIATRQYQAVIAGELNASGSLAAPRIGGRIEVLNGAIRPDLGFLAASSQLGPDDTITVIAPGQRAPEPAMMRSPPPPVSKPVQPSQFNNLTIGLTVQIDRDTWIRHDLAAAELEGRLRINKAPQGSVRIIGKIDTVRGWIIYQQRRFDLQSGEISFNGGPTIDPGLNIDARYTLPDYLVDVIVRGTAGQPLLELKSHPDLAQADILALIMFGKTTSALGQGEQQSLQAHAMQMAGGYAAGQIGQVVSQSLGLEALGVQLSGLSTTGGSVGFGHYIGANTYVSASEDIGGQGRKVSIQYYLLRWLSITTTTSSTGGSGISMSLHKQY